MTNGPSSLPAARSARMTSLTCSLNWRAEGQFLDSMTVVAGGRPIDTPFLISLSMGPTLSLSTTLGSQSSQNSIFRTLTGSQFGLALATGFVAVGASTAHALVTAGAFITGSAQPFLVLIAQLG